MYSRELELGLARFRLLKNICLVNEKNTQLIVSYIDKYLTLSASHISVCACSLSSCYFPVIMGSGLMYLANNALS